MGENVHKNKECGTGRRHLSLVNMKKAEKEKHNAAKAPSPDVILLIEVDSALWGVWGSASKVLGFFFSAIRRYFCDFSKSIVILLYLDVVYEILPPRLRACIKEGMITVWDLGTSGGHIFYSTFV